MKTRAILIGAGLSAVVPVGWAIHRATRPPESRPEPPPSPAQKLAREESAAREALAVTPNDPRARLRLARVLRKANRAQEAITELGHAVRAGLPDGEGQREFALISSTLPWDPRLEGLFQRVTRDNPEDRELLLAVADCYAATNRWRDAEPLYSKVIALDPRNIAARFKRGAARMNQALYATAAEDFRAAATANTDDYQTRLYLGNCLLGDARMASAERELLWCHAERPTAVEPLVGLAACAAERNDVAGAEALLARAGGRESTSPAVLQGLAELYFRQQRTDLAVTTLRKLVALDPKNRQGHLRLAQALLAAGQPDEARRHEDIYKELDRQFEAQLHTPRGMR